MKAKTKTKVKKLRGGTEPAGREPAPNAKANRTYEQQLAVTLAAAIASCCSEPWADVVELGRSEWPIPGMKLGGAKVLTTGLMVSNNYGRQGARRWTPAYNVGLEDALDEMSIKAASRYYHPSAIMYGPRFDYHVDPCPSVRLDPEEWITRRVMIVPWEPDEKWRGRIRKRTATAICREGTCRARWPADRLNLFPEEMQFQQVVVEP